MGANSKISFLNQLFGASSSRHNLKRNTGNKIEKLIVSLQCSAICTPTVHKRV